MVLSEATDVFPRSFAFRSRRAGSPKAADAEVQLLNSVVRLLLR